MVKELTFNELPQAVMELQQQQAALLAIAKAIFAKIDEKKPNNDLVFGIFERNEQILLSDKRLWSLPTSPFRSKRQVEYAKSKNPKLFTRPKNQRKWSCKASKLEKWFNESGQTNIEL